jgi:hypothetical protein
MSEQERTLSFEEELIGKSHEELFKLGHWYLEQARANLASNSGLAMQLKNKARACLCSAEREKAKFLYDQCNGDINQLPPKDQKFFNQVKRIYQIEKLLHAWGPPDPRDRAYYAGPDGVQRKQQITDSDINNFFKFMFGGENVFIEKLEQQFPPIEGMPSIKDLPSTPFGE